MKQIKNVETGKVYNSVTSAARDVGVSPGLIVHVLKGRQKSAGGYSWVYSDEDMPKTIRTIKHSYRSRRGNIVRDDAGNVYDSVKSMSVAKGIDPKRAYYLLSRDPEGIFRNEHLRPLPRHRFVFTGRNIDKRETQRSVLSVAPNMSVQKLHNALDKVIYEGHDASSVYYGETGWEIEIVTHDLFANIGRMRR